MTLTLELPTEIEAALRADAAAHGVEPSQWALGMLAERYQMKREADETARRKRVAAGYGKYAGLGSTVDEFLREKHEETEREMQLEAERDRMGKQHTEAA